MDRAIGDMRRHGLSCEGARFKKNVCGSQQPTLLDQCSDRTVSQQNRCLLQSFLCTHANPPDFLPVSFVKTRKVLRSQKGNGDGDNTPSSDSRSS